MPVNDTIADEQWRRYVYCRDRGHIEFLSKAEKCDKFFVGDQWLQTDLDALTLQRRPALTINKILSTVSTLLGEQIANRVEVLFRPSEGAPSEVADALSKVWMQIARNNQLEWLRSDVFADGLIRSRGFYDVRMDYTDSVFGEVRLSQINSKNVVIDPDGEEYDPDKWNDVYTTKWMTTQDIATLFNEDDAEILRERGPLNRFGYDSMDRLRDTFGGLSFMAGQGNWPASGFDLTTFRNVRVLDRQYRKLDKQKHFVDIATGDMRPIPEGWDRNRIAAFLEKMGGAINVTKKLVKRIRWTVTADNVVLHDEWSPYKHFTVVPYFPNFRYGKTVGVVENLLSPQEILNKTASQELHIVNTTANSGYIVEENSLANMSVEELELNGAQTGLIIEYRKGSQPPAKIQPNQPPSGMDRIGMKAEEHIKSISGVSDSMQGFDRADVAAKAIAYKRQQGSINAGKILDNLSRTDYILARNVLDLVQEFYTDERLVTITHTNVQNSQETIAVNQIDPVTGAITNDLTLGEYDIIITNTPAGQSLEDSQFEQARALREIGVPIPDAVLIENSRLLNRNEIIQQMTAMQNSPEAQQQAQIQMGLQQAELEGQQIKNQKTAADAQLQQVRAAKEAGQDASAQAEMEKAQQEMSIEERRAAMEMELERFKVEQEMELRRWEMEQELTLKREQMHFDMQIKQQQAEQQAAAQRVAQSQTADTDHDKE